MEKLNIDEAWSKYVKIEYIDGWASYDCKKGLWGCSGPDGPDLLQTAKHYFWQYFEDGEYFTMK